ncbi:MAG TPA: hypothetical protein VFL83_14795 [Anaeromyxobacter sp.]|nr:hypothetical protein [Anaeromyxobacter sp.]
MKKTIARAAVVGALLAASAADAQWYETYKPRESLYMFNYEVSSAVGSFSDDFISETSWRGFGFEGRSMIRDNVSVGLGFDFNRYSQEFARITQPTGNGGTISGPVYRYADQFAFKGLGHLYLRPGQLRPYLGLGIGGVWSYSYSQTADLAVADDGFDFIVTPEAGILLTAARGASSAGLNLAVRYTYTTATFQKVSDAQSFAVILGLFVGY